MEKKKGITVVCIFSSWEKPEIKNFSKVNGGTFALRISLGWVAFNFYNFAF